MTLFGTLGWVWHKPFRSHRTPARAFRGQHTCHVETTAACMPPITGWHANPSAQQISSAQQCPYTWSETRMVSCAGVSGRASGTRPRRTEPAHGHGARTQSMVGIVGKAQNMVGMVDKAQNNGAWVRTVRIHTRGPWRISSYWPPGAACAEKGGRDGT
eukprot:353272-Chlamydomonas_euryale.AAC.14